MQRRSFLQASIASMALFALRQGQTAENPIIIGQSCALSGTVAALSQDYNLGARLWFDTVNRKGGVHGQKIELVTLDDAYDPERAARNTDLLINKHNAVALFGYVGTATTDAARPIFERNNVPFLAPFTGANSLRTTQSNLIYNIRASYDDETERLVKHFASIGQKRLGVAYQDDAFGRAGLEGVEKAMRTHGGNLIVKAALPRNSTDIQNAAATLIKAGAVDALIVLSTYAPTAALISALRKSNYVATFATLSVVGVSSLQEALGKDVDGIVVSQVVPWGATPVVSEFKKLFAQEYPDRQPNHVALEGFIAAKSLELALQRSKSISRSELNATLGQTKADLGGFRIDFTSRRQSGQYTDLIMLKRNGNLAA